MVRGAAAALVTALLVAACGSGSHSTSQSSSASSTAAGPASAASTTVSSSQSSSAPAQSSSSPSRSSSSTSTTAAAAGHHSHTQPPESTPHFIVKLKIGSGGKLTPPSVAIGGHTKVALSVSNASGASARFEISHGSHAVFKRSLPAGQTTADLPALKNATYTLAIDGRPKGTLTIGARAGP